MPTVTVQGPDGKRYTVNAPKGATDEAIMKYVQAQVAKSRKAEEPTTAQNLHGAVSSLLDGVIPGAGGAVSGVVGALQNPYEPVASFKQARKTSERNEERFKEKHPYLAAAATGTGFVGSLFVPVTKLGLAAKGAEALSGAAKVGLGGRVLNSAANGAIMGTTSGALSSHADSVGGALRDAARGGVLGGAAAGLLPIAGRLAAPVVAPIASAASRRAAPWVAAAGRALPGAVGRRLENAGRMMAVPAADARANRYIGGKMEQAGTDPAALMTELQRRHALGVPAAPADTHEVLRDAYGSAARRPGPATAAVRRAIDTRQREMTGRVSGHISETLGPVTNVEQQAQALRREAEAAARPLYDISDAQHIPLVKELRELFDTPSGKEAMQIAGRELQDRRANLTDMGLVQDADGAFRLGQAPTMPFYDHMKSVLDEGVFAGDRAFAPREASRFGKGAREIRRDLLNIMDGDGSGPRIPQPREASPGMPSGAPSGPALPPPAQAALPGSAARGLPSPPPGVGRPPKVLPPPEVAPQPPGTLPVPYEAPGGLGAHGAEVPAIPQADEAFAPFDAGQRLHPEAPQGPQVAAQPPLGSAIPDNGLNPYWRPAREAYAGPTQNRKALELGQDMAKDNAVDAANRMENMTSGSQRDFFRLGHRTGIAQDVRNLGDYGNAARRVDGNLDARDAISYVHGQAPANALFDRLGAEHEGYQTWAAVRGNSMTAGREASDEVARQEQALSDTGRGLWAVAQGRALDGARHFSSAFSGEPALTNRVNELTAERLGSTDLGAVRGMLGDVRRARVSDAAVSRKADKVQKQAAKLIGSRTGAGVSTPDDEVLLGYGERGDGTYYPVYGPPGGSLAEGFIPAGL